MGGYLSLHLCFKDFTILLDSPWFDFFLGVLLVIVIGPYPDYFAIPDIDPRGFTKQGEGTLRKRFDNCFLGPANFYFGFILCQIKSLSFPSLEG